MTGPKSLLEVKDGRTFLDVIAEQVLDLRGRSGARLPLVLMNSFATRDASLDGAGRARRLEADVPLDFVQNKVPKILADGPRARRSGPPTRALEWCPPGHGDLYTALQTSGMLERLLDEGYRYAFVSNVDNLGAVLDPRILAWFAGVRRAVREGGHRPHGGRQEGRAPRPPGRRSLVLREIAQTPDEDLDAFQDIGATASSTPTTCGSTCRRSAALLAERGPRARPAADRQPQDRRPGATSRRPPVIQLETAMGAAIGVFDGAVALRVPRHRFLPVKTTNDLLVLRSDAYVLIGRATRRARAGPRRRAARRALDDEFKLVARLRRALPGRARRRWSRRSG